MNEKIFTHDVLSIARIIDKIKEQLAIKKGPLKKVCVAAVDRSLRTKKHYD